MAPNDNTPTLSADPGGKALILATLVLLAVGVVSVPSALDSVSAEGPWYARTSVRHMAFAVLAAAVVLTAWRLDYRTLARGGRLFPLTAGVILALAVISSLLVFVPGLGRSVGSYHRWIRIGPARYAIGFQPSELVKLSLVVFLAAWLSRPETDVRSFRKTFVPAVIIVGLCLALVITQDFGTAVMIALAAGVTMLLAGVRWYFLAALAAWAAGAFYAILTSSPRRWLRIEAMFDPFSTSNPSAYQLRQSLQAVATGGWTGRGLGMGMMKRGFLPEDSTDFIYAIICEEWGFIGAAALIAVLIVWLILARRAAARAGDRFGQVLAGSLAFLITLQAAMHIAVNVGWLPPTGIAMPFVSAGGTSLILLATATALIISVSVRGGDAQGACE